MTLHERFHQCLTDLGVEDHGQTNVHILWKLIYDLFPERNEMMRLRAQSHGLADDLKVQKWRTDKIRDAVIDYLSGDLSRRKLRRAVYNTDYTTSVFE